MNRAIAGLGHFPDIPDPEMFVRDYCPGKVEEILTNTRKVLEELYRLPPA